MSRCRCLLALAMAFAMTSTAELRFEKLRCEYLEEPLCVHETSPRLTWTMFSETRGERQVAYRLLVASTLQKLAAGKGDLWDSGKVRSDENALVPYSGKPLASRQDCYWQVQVWNQDNALFTSQPAHWRMGLLAPKDWNGAEWIFIPGNDNQYRTAHNGFHTQFSKQADVNEWVQVDLGKSTAIQSIRLYPTCPYDYSPRTPGFLFPVRYKLEVSLDSGFSTASTVFDSTQEDFPNPGSNVVVHDFPSCQARYVRLTANKVNASRDGYAFTLAEMEVLSGKDNVARGKKVESSSAIVANSWSQDRLVDGRLQPDAGNTVKTTRPTRFRKSFTLKDIPSRASIAVTGLGTYELFINGRRVGDTFMAPEWSAYGKRIFYQVYDVADFLKPGENVIAAEVAAGWWDSPMFAGRAVPGADYCLKADLELDNGTHFVTDTSWLAHRDGPVRRAEIYYGMDYDGTKEQPGWNNAGYDSAGWNSVSVLPHPALSPDALLLGQPMEAIRCEQELRPLEVTSPKPNIYVYDMGQNMVGLCRLHANLPKGTKVTVLFGEMLNPDGTVYRANLRGAQELYTIVWPGGERTLEPRHTYYGYRYVEIRGLSAQPSLDNFTGLVLFSSSPAASTLVTSNPLLNKLSHCIQWNQRGNMFSTGTDCPQRDERMGWTADMFSFAQTAIFNRDMAAFLTKYQQDIVDEQKADGSFPDVAPGVNQASNFFGAPGWADAGVHLPWRLYQNYADKRALERFYEPARRWIDLVLTNSPGFIWTKNRMHDYGEWLNGDTLILDGYPHGHCEMPKEQFATAIFAYSTHIVAEMAAVLGKTEDAKKYGKLFEDIRNAFQNKYMNHDGTFRHETQASYALALNFGIATPAQRDKMMERILACIHDYKDHLSTGFHATHRIMLELSQSGHHDESNRLLNLRTVPSWGYMIDNGATTLWERWDGYVAGRGFQNPGMNSFNHWAFGSVGEWVWRTLVGLNPVDLAPGYKHVVIQPRPDAQTARIQGTFDSIRGTFSIESDWTVDTGQYMLSIVIPPSASATVHVPRTDMDTVRESSQPLSANKFIRLLRQDHGATVLELPSGRYQFTSVLKK